MANKQYRLSEHEWNFIQFLREMSPDDLFIVEETLRNGSLEYLSQANSFRGVSDSDAEESERRSEVLTRFRKMLDRAWLMNRVE